MNPTLHSYLSLSPVRVTFVAGKATYVVIIESILVLANVKNVCPWLIDLSYNACILAV